VELATDVLALFGPTAAGKSALAHAVARALEAEIVVADPFQRYRGLEIAADAPSPPQRLEVPYHFVGDLALTESSSAGAFATAAHATIDAIRARGRLAIVTGGSALYLRAALTDLGFPPPVAPETRTWAEAVVSADRDQAAAELARLDPDAAARVDLANPRRLVRALEIAATPKDASHATGRLWDETMRVHTWLGVVMRPRDVLDAMIATRVRRELDDGLVVELQRALATPGASREALQIIGAREVAALGAGAIAPDQLPELLATRTRRLARRQLAWARRWPHAHPIDLGARPTIEALPELLAAWRQVVAPQ